MAIAIILSMEANRAHLGHNFDKPKGVSQRPNRRQHSEISVHMSWGMTL